MKASAASSSSGSGRVIAGLQVSSWGETHSSRRLTLSSQSELLSARSAVDMSRNQLRMNQRAVEHLTKTSGQSCSSRRGVVVADYRRR